MSSREVGLPPLLAEGVDAAVASVFADVLGLDTVGADDDLFSLGGTSLSAIQLATRLGELTGSAVTLREVFENPTPRRLAELLASASPPSRFTGHGFRLRTLPVLPLQEARVRLRARWSAEIGAGVPPHQNHRAAFRIDGELDASALDEALATVARRHEVLRTAIGRSGGIRLVQRVRQAVPRLELVDLSARPPDERDRVLAEALDDDGRRWLAIERAEVMRARLYRLDARAHALSLVFDSVAHDGYWSWEICIRELGEAYTAIRRGVEPRLPALPVQVGDVALRQRRLLRGREGRRLLAYWRTQLAGVGPIPEVEIAGTRLGLEPSYREGRETRPLPGPTRAAIERLGRMEGVTLFAIGLASLVATLAAYSGRPRFGIVCPATTRDRDGLELLIGPFVNLLVVVVDVEGDPSFVELVQRTRTSTVASYAHQDMPFDALVAALAPERYAAPTSRPTIVYGADALPSTPLELAGAHVAPLRLAPGAADNTGVGLTPLADGSYRLEIEHELTWVPPEAATRFLRDWESVLTRAVERPERRLTELRPDWAAQ